MAEFKLRNEIGLNRTLAVLEPARECAASCTFCFVRINRRAQWAGRKQRPDHDPGTFESTVEKAFGPGYDPTDILQWGLKNKVPFVYASTVEPFQDIHQARSILRTIRALKLPTFFQTRATNWREAWDDVAPLAGDAGFYVSIPSLDPRYVKRFEPGTPPIDERIALVRACREAGIPAMVAIAPYHPSWCPDLPGMVREIHSWGATDVFMDRLHLSQRQRDTIRDVGGDRLLLELEPASWSDAVAEEWHQASDLCADLGMGFETVAFEALVHGVESFPSPEPWPFRTARRWPYAERAFLDELQDLHADDPGGPILLDWPDALALMEADGGPVGQPFSWKSVGELIAVKTLAPAWRKALGDAAPFRDYLRALWNTPRNSGFPWHHPFVRYATRPDGTPWLGAGGDLVMAFDPHYPGKALARPFDSLDDHRWLAFEEAPDASVPV